MSSISVSSLVLGSLTVEVDGSDSTLALSVLATAPATLSIELGTPGAQGDAATIAVGTTTTLSPGSSATVTNVGSSSAAVFNFGIPQGTSGVVTATAPLSYNSGTQNISIDLSSYAPLTGFLPITVTNGTVTTTVAQGEVSVSSVSSGTVRLQQGGISFGDGTGQYTAANLAGYATQSWVTSQGYATTSSLGSAAYESTSYWIQSPSVAATDGQIPAWDAASSRSVWIDNSARSLFLVAVNKTGSTIAKGACVYVSGATGNRPEISLARADAEPTSSKTIGVTTSAIANNGTGNVVVGGAATGLDTSAFTEGQVLYLSPTVAGGFVTALPTQPNHGVLIGYVTRSNNSNGIIEVSIQNYQELSELSDVLISSKANNDLLAWDSASSVWKNKTFSTLGLLTSATAASTYYLQTNPANYIDATALAPYLTIASAAATYQTTAGMSAYLTTATASATYLASANNLSELTATASTARTNLGLGTAAVEPATKLVPSGGTTGQVLSKVSGTDWDLTWTTVSGGGGATWGSITGTLSSQTDLQTALDAKAPLASPTLTGTPLSTTAAADTNTTQIATTAYVVGQASSTTPAATGTAAVGTSLKYARADHVHANPLPTGGTTGQVLAKVDGTNYNVQWTTAGGGSGGVDVQTFGSSTSSGTFSGASGWQKPAGAKWVEFLLIGGGGGGGAGARRATSSGRTGGGGGAGGPSVYGRINADYLSSTETVVIGAGGSGAVSQTTDSLNGASGSNGTATTFSLFISGYGNLGGGGAIASAGGGNGQASASFVGVTTGLGGGGGGTTTNGTPATSYAVYWQLGLGGGGGGGAAATVTTNSSGGAGGGFTGSTSSAGLTTSVAGGSGGNPTGPVAATAGTSASTQYQFGGTGGGGGFYRTGATGGAGGNGGWPGGGGGGGGASDNGFASGAGGNGANGFAVIITYF